MTQKEAINELKCIINRYEPFFFDWIKSKDCSLSEQNIQLIEVHIKNKFVIEFHKMFMANYQTRNINPVVEKLITEYSAYNAWVINWFYNSVRDITGEINKDILLETLLENLNIADTLKKPLLKLECKTLGIILSKRQDIAFINPTIFAIMIEFLQVKNQADKLAAVPGNTLFEKI